MRSILFSHIYCRACGATLHCVYWVQCSGILPSVHRLLSLQTVGLTNKKKEKKSKNKLIAIIRIHTYALAGGSIAESFLEINDISLV